MQRSESIRIQALASIIDSRHQTKKDTKSIGQNLYDSVSLIYSYSKSIPSSSLAIDTLRASIDGTQIDEYSANANGAAVTAHASGTTSTSLHHSKHSLHAQNQAHAVQEHSHVLSNGQRVHKVPYFPPTASDEVGSIANGTHSSSENMTEASKMSIMKSGRKSFTLGASIAPYAAKSRVAAPPIPRHKSKISNPNRRGSIPTTSFLNCAILEQLKDDVNTWVSGKRAISTIGDEFTQHQNRFAKDFVDRSLFYTLGDAETLLKSFHDNTEAFRRSPLPHLDSIRLVHSFRDWSQLNGPLIFDSLYISVGALYNRPPALNAQVPDKVTPKPNHCPAVDPSNQNEAVACSRYLNNQEAAHIVMICIHALTSLVPVAWPQTWVQLRSLRSWGVIIPNVTADADSSSDPYANIIDSLEYEPAVRLAHRMLQAIGVRNCFDHILTSMQENSGLGENAPEDSLSSVLVRHLQVTEPIALESKRKLKPANVINKEPGWTVTATLVEWLKTIIIKKWDGNVEINKWTSVGTAIMLLHELRE